MLREIEYVKCNPTQNMTILVKTRQQAQDYKRVASKIMSCDSVFAEQVGFIEQPVSPMADASLQMAGGEFCGNGCMALAVYLAAERDIQPEEQVSASAVGRDAAAGHDRMMGIMAMLAASAGSAAIRSRAAWRSSTREPY